MRDREFERLAYYSRSLSWVQKMKISLLIALLRHIVDSTKLRLFISRCAVIATLFVVVIALTENQATQIICSLGMGVIIGGLVVIWLVKDFLRRE